MLYPYNHASTASTLLLASEENAMPTNSMLNVLRNAHQEAQLTPSELCLHATLDLNVTDAVALLATLTLVGVCVTEAMHLVRDAVHCGLAHV